MDTADARVLSRCTKPSGALDATANYKLCTFSGFDVPLQDFFLRNPPIQFFAWLLVVQNLVAE
jgi:hypothetical protein